MFDAHFPIHAPQIVHHSCHVLWTAHTIIVADAYLQFTLPLDMLESCSLTLSKLQSILT